MASGQGFDWVFYSENGEDFSLIIDGEKINSVPQSRVVAKNVKGVLKTVRIEFKDTRLPKVSKRVPLRPKLKELTTIIKQNNKGEYILRIIDGSGEVIADENSGTPESEANVIQQPSTSGVAIAPATTQSTSQAQVSTAQPVTSSGPVTAKFDGQNITLSNGKSYTVKRERDQSGMNGPQVIMKAPEGALVTITQDGGKEVYNGDVPFVYTVKDYNYYNTYFKLEVTDGKDKWSVKMQNGTSYRFVIEQGATGPAIANDQPVSTSPASYSSSSSSQQNGTIGQQQATAGQQNATAGQQQASAGQQNATAGQQQATAGQQNAAAGSSYAATSNAAGAPVNWIIYSEMGERFIVFLDGQRINPNFEESVTATNLTGASRGIRIEFEDKSIPKLLKRYPIVPGGDMTIMIKKKKKGEYITRVVSAPASSTPIPDMEPTAKTSAPVTSSGPVTAKYDGESITLSNGMSYTVKRERDQSGMNGPQVIMKAPEGATVTITQDGGKEVYNGEVPFVYEVKTIENYNTYFKLEVTEGNQKWSVKMQNGTGYRLVITE
jgi:hypothetical protein